MDEVRPPILVVEDENVVAMDLVSTLAKLRYPIAGVASTGEDAVILAGEKNPGLVLMDIHLRGQLDGIAAAERIQERYFIPVVYLTAYSDQGTLDRARVTQPFGYILKPFEDREIEVAIQLALFRHKMERALRDSEKQLEAILTSIGDAVVATDTARRITFLNRAAETLLGWKSDRAKARLLTDVLKVSQHEDGALRLSPPGRHAVPIELVESPVLDASGTIKGYVTVVRDLSERLRAQEAHDRALVERAARMAAEKEHQRAWLEGEISRILGDITELADETKALSEAVDLIAQSLGAWCVLHLQDGPTAQRVTAHPKAEKAALATELVRRTATASALPFGTHAVLHGGQPQWMPEVSDAVLVQSAPDPECLELLRKIDVRSYVCVPLRAHQRVFGALNLVLTETDQRYEASDVPFAQQLADRVGLAVDNARLFRTTRQAEKQQTRLVHELERAVRFSEMFVGILGHDLRNPLSGITTAASLALNRADSDRVTKPIARILSSAVRMSRMIDQILDFTRVRLGGGIPLHRRTIDLVEVCRLAVDELRGGAEESSEIRLEAEGEAIGSWDEDRLAQLVSNLAGNALQHGRRGFPIVVSVDGSRPDAVTMVIQNQGCFPPELLPVTFEPLPGGKLPKRVGSLGLGLGLYISQQIVLSHGGSIRVESQADRDRTLFTVELPRLPPDDSTQVFGIAGTKEAT